MSDNKFNAVVWRLFYAVGQQEAGSLVLCPLRWGGGVIFGSEHLSIVQTDLRCDTAAGPNTRSRIRPY